MRIVREEYDVRCDIGHCKNTSSYAIEVDDNKRHNIHICKACFDELYSHMARIKTPKSVENVVRRAENRRNEWQDRR